MALTPGTRLGPYEISAQIGVGGMGEVYQATDTKLKRQVAIKVLPAAVAADHERLARFQREAEVLASLNHPNIAAIYGLEEGAVEAGADGTPSSGEGSSLRRTIRALVMELVEGPTLADRIADGPIPVDEALPIARQIAEALEAAHEQGIIHRDLKPANVKVRPDGTVKVLDFGLAKAMDPPSAMSPGASQLPTITTPAMTQAGMILGTAAYMSPEQARGRATDKRSDIWAFGVVLYEMLTGQRAFPGDDVTDTIASVVKLEPDWAAVPPEVPARVRHVLRVCLQKHPQQRGGDIAAIRLALDGAFETAAPPHTASPATAAPPPTWRQPVPVAAAALVIGGLLVALAAWAFVRPAVAPGDLMRFVIVPPDDAPMNFVGDHPDLAVSPDGTLVVYRGPGAAGTGPQLNLRPMDQVVGTPLRGADGGVGPFFSPDGAWVGFVDFQGFTTLKKVSTFGGPPVTIAELQARILGAHWGADDQIIVGTTSGLFRVPGGGGEPEALTTVDAEQGERYHLWPFRIPDRNAVLFVAGGGGPPLNRGQLAVLDLDTRDVRRLGLAGVSPRYLSTGHLVYAVEDGSVRAVPFDVASLTVTGNPVPLVEGVVVKNSGAANFSISNNGRLVYALGAGGGGLQRRLRWVSRDGRAEAIAAAAAAYAYPRLSPDGGRVALDARGDDPAIWIWDFAQETRTRLIVGDGAAIYPVWTPDGTRMAYGLDHVIDWKAANNTGTAEQLADPASDGEDDPTPYFFAPDGAALVFRDQEARDTRDDLAMIPVAGDGEAIWRLTGGFNERNAELSPNGRWMAYQSDESGEWQIYVRPFPQVDDDLVAVSNDGGLKPL